MAEQRSELMGVEETTEALFRLLYGNPTSRLGRYLRGEAVGPRPLKFDEVRRLWTLVDQRELL